MSFMPESNFILKTERLGIKYNLDFYLEGTLRDKFVGMVKSPLSFFMENPTPHWALRDFNFEIKKGDRVGILGRNGAGKTTLCRTIGQMLLPSEGNIHLNGDCRPIFNASVGILPELTGRENLELLTAFLYPELDQKSERELLSEVIHFSELEDFIDAPYQHYSKGMQSRLFLSLISARPSDLIILDEVFDGADIFFQEKVNRRFKMLLDQSGAAIFVSHNPHQILDVCNRVIVLEHGKKVFDGDVTSGIKFYEESKQ